MPLNERKIVDHIKNFIQLNTGTKLTELEKSVDLYIESGDVTKENFSDDEKQMLRTALSIHVQASRAEIVGQQVSYKEVGIFSNTIDFLIIPPFYRPYGYWGGCGCGGWGSMEGEALCALVIIIAICSAIAATYGLLKDTFESFQELFRNQMVAANLANLLFTAACVTATCVGVIAILASNPIGWAAFGSACLVMAAALLVKAVRNVLHVTDAALSKNSAIDSDSRFYLSKYEINSLKKLFTSEDIEKIKALVRVLALKAEKTDRIGFFGTKDDYKTIINLLTEVKKGNIPDKIAKKFNITMPVSKPGAEEGLMVSEPKL